MTELKEFKLPDVGEGLTEADIVAWHVKPGDQVEVNQIIVEIETAKAVVELPSPWDGMVARLLVEEGQTVDVGTPIIAVEVPGAGSAVAGTNDSAERSVAPAPATTDAAPAGAPPAPAAAVGRTSSRERARPARTAGGAGRLRGQGLVHHAPGAQARRARPRPPRQRPNQSRPNQHLSGRWPSRRSAGWPRISAST